MICFQAKGKANNAEAAKADFEKKAKDLGRQVICTAMWLQIP